MAEYEDDPIELTENTPVGTKVICVQPNGDGIEKDKIYTIRRIFKMSNGQWLCNLKEAGSQYYLWRFAYL